jgi:hypothetical protein
MLASLPGVETPGYFQERLWRSVVLVPTDRIESIHVF